MDVFYGIKILKFYFWQIFKATQLPIDQNNHLGQHNFFFQGLVEKKLHSHKASTFPHLQKSFRKLQKLLTLYECTQKLKKPDLGLWSFRG
jgi:hypothetical protein